MDSKLPQTGTTIFTVMSQLAAKCDAINLAQGFPELDPDSRLIDKVTQYMKHGANQYAPMSGVPELRTAVASKVQQLYDRTVDPESEVTVCSGATEGLFSTIQACIRPGDEVIVFDPAYDSYEPSVTLAGAVTRHIPLISTDERPDLHIDLTALSNAIRANTRLIILNFPHNPSGAILNAKDLDGLASVLQDTDVLLLSDEVYEHIVFDGAVHHSLLRHDELWQRSFVVSSFGKTYHATGWKIGYCVAPEALSREFRKTHQWNTFATCTPMQLAIADYMQERPEHYAELASFYERKRDLFLSLLDGSRFTSRPAAGTFFQTLDYSAISDEEDMEFAERLTRDIGVASIPVSAFCADKFGERHRTLRFCFAKNDETLERAAENLCRL